jgi:hypothetical protein
MMEWTDWLFILVIFVVSYWIAFISGVSKLIVDTFDGKRKKKPRGTITGDNITDKSRCSYIQRVRASYSFCLFG